MKGNHVARLLAYVTGLVNQELLLQVEYLVAENESSGRTRQFGCAWPTRSVTRWPRSAPGWDEKDWRKWLWSQSPRPSSAGFGNWWHRSSMAPNIVYIPVGRGSAPKWRR